MTSTANPQAAPRHLPVMPEEVIAALAPKDGGIYVDGTFGAGGHTRLLLERAQARVYAIDRDPSAIRDGRALQGIFGDRLVLLEGRFSEMIDLMAAAGVERVDGILLDIGVASMQLDDGARGFSFTHDGPLDMRMAGHGVSAADVVNTLEEPALKHLLRVLGEERRAHAVVRAIAAARGRAPITRTSELLIASTPLLPEAGWRCCASRKLRIVCTGTMVACACAVAAPGARPSSAPESARG